MSRSLRLLCWLATRSRSNASVSEIRCRGRRSCVGTAPGSRPAASPGGWREGDQGAGRRDGHSRYRGADALATVTSTYGIEAGLVGLVFAVVATAMITLAWALAR